jgi:hypothetical protein
MTLSAQTPPPPYCFTSNSTPPNLGTTAQGIAPNNNAFVSDYNKLSQAAWCSFIALNWAAAGNGSPTMTADASKPLGTCANLGTTACSLVWQTWRPSDKVYNANPLPCSGGPPEPQTHRLRMGNPNTARANPHAPGQFMRQPPKAPPAAKKGVKAIAPPTVPTQATGFILPDRHNSQSSQSVILYETRENPSACTTLTTPIAVPGTSVKAALNTAEQQVALYNAAAKLLPQPPPGFIQFQGSAFEVKPSWYQFQSGDPTPQQLGMISATGSTGSGATFTVGLTGFHIIWKVFPNSSWFWMTFEYAGSNPWTQPYISKGQPPNTYFTPVLANSVTLYQPSGTYCNVQPNGPCTQSGSGPCTCPNYGPFTPPAPVPCMTNPSGNLSNPAPCSPVGAAAAAANAQFQKLVAGTPLANYQLVGAQVAPTLNNINTLLANNHIETDFGSNAQSNGPGNPSSSCITCHFLASIGSCNAAGKYINRASIFQNYGSTGYQTGNGFTGAFPTSQYSLTNGNGGPFLTSDFVWSVQEAPSTTGNPCSSSAK